MNKTTISGPPPVTVTVSDATDPPTVISNPHTAVVTEPNSLVVFNLTTPGYVFPTTGAILVENGGAEFPNLWYVSPTEVALHDLCAVAGEYKYWVVVEEASSGTQFKVDPRISNEPI